MLPASFELEPLLYLFDQYLLICPLFLSDAHLEIQCLQLFEILLRILIFARISFFTNTSIFETCFDFLITETQSKINKMAYHVFTHSVKVTHPPSNNNQF